MNCSQRNIKPLVLILSLAILFALPAALPAALSAAPAAGIDYLAQQSSITVPSEEWTWDSFNDALTVLTDTDIEAFEAGDEPELLLSQAIRNAVLAADYEELALSYPEDKINDRLTTYELETAGDPETDRYIVTGLDAQLFDAETAAEALQGETASSEQLADLLYNVAEAQGKTRQYLAYSDDPKIDALLQQVWQTFAIFSDEDLNEIGRQAVEQQLVTGFNVKRGAFDAKFDPDYTLQYGHSSLEHAHQLMVLLNSEDIRAKVQLEPKVSIYEYLLDWGEPSEPTLTYAVEEVDDDFYLAHAVEYDLLLEFDTEEEMLRFDELVQTYAKKWEGNEDAVGLIRDSWWQPLYTSLRDDMPEDSYYKIHDLIIRSEDNDYRFHSFVLDENLDATITELESLADGLTVESQVRYCNQAFYNYLTGDDFQ